MNPLEAALFAMRLSVSGSANAEIYPGMPQYLSDISYWIPDTVAGRRVVEQAIE